MNEIVRGMDDYTTIEISKEDIKFSAAHFTIFSATERERLHGHNFAVSVTLTAPVADDGLCFGYNEIKKKVRALCAELDEYALLPEHSPYLSITTEGDQYRVQFAEDTLFFLCTDTILLPIRNSTVEEYSRYLLTRLVGDHTSFFAKNDVRSIVLRVATGPGQWGATTWRKP